MVDPKLQVSHTYLLVESIDEGKPVKDDQEDKIEVGKPVELLENILWYKR